MKQRMTGRLDGDDWQLRGFLGDEWRWHLDKPWDAPGWMPARVPGSVLDDLWRAGEIPDPYVARNTLAAEWVWQRAWVYRRRISSPGDGNAVLRFDGVDHAATVCLDGDVVAAHEGMFVPFEVDVTDALADGAEHLLAVVVHPAPANEPQVGETHRVSVHKSRMGYGWDFCPRLVHQGVWRPVTLTAWRHARLVDVSVGTMLAEDLATGSVEVVAEVEGVADAGLRVTVADGDTVVASSVEDVRVDGRSRVRSTLPVERPRLWWPNGAGEQPLYRVGVELSVPGVAPGASGTERYVGFRHLAGLPHEPAVNGERMFVKGWNWVPLDALYGVPRPEKLDHLLRLAKEANVNLLRVWGGGLIETPGFYDRCDRLGLLVWQEFAMSSSGFASVPSDAPGFVDLMVRDAHAIVPPLRHHPSLAMWCGGNELAGPEGPLDDTTPVLGALRDVVRELDPGRAWLPTSPSPHDDHGPWEHQGVNEHQRCYDAGTTPLHSEFGVEGMTNPRTLDAVVPAGSRWPADRDNPVYAHLGAWWNNAPLVRASFGGRLHDLDTLGRASRFLQADGLRYAVEANRRRAPRCGGTLPWQFDESYPNAWCTAAVDHRGDPKPAYHAVRRAYSRHHVSAAFERQAWAGESAFAARVWACLDAAGPATVTARLVDVWGMPLADRTWTVDLPAGEARQLGELTADLTVSGSDVVVLDLSLDAGDGGQRNRYLFSRTDDLAPLLDLPPATVDVEARHGSDSTRIRARHVDGPAALGLVFADGRRYDAPGWAVFSDNWLDLLPGESAAVDVRWRAAGDERLLSLDGWNVTVPDVR
ncbi:MAG TPA: glycoside hydrolase family 2 TIM barrel-domain containing protein [Streptosporangiales bacterium]